MPFLGTLLQQKVEILTENSFFMGDSVFFLRRLLKIWKKTTKLNTRKHWGFFIWNERVPPPILRWLLVILFSRMVDLSQAHASHTSSLRYVVVLSLGGSGRGSCWSLAIHHVSMQHFQTPSFGYLAFFCSSNGKAWARGSTGSSVFYFGLWSGCEDLLVEDAWVVGQHISANLEFTFKIWILCMEWTWQGHLLLVQRPFTILVFGGSLESFGGHPSWPWPQPTANLRSWFIATIRALVSWIGR